MRPGVCGNPFHERLARIGLAAAQRYGFALAGGCAVQAAGLLERPSKDIDRRIVADAIGRADLLDPDDFAQYGITDQALDDIRSRFAACRRELRDESSSA